MTHPIVVRHLWVLRHGRPWNLLVEGIFEPFLYLMSIGLGIGQLIGGGDYAAFVAPALLATSAMNSAVNEMVGGFWWRARFQKLYDAIVTTPMRVRDIAVGETLAAVLRASLSSACFLAVVAALGLVRSWWAVLAIPALVLVAFAFSGAGLLVATLMREPHHNQYLQLAMLPMFLFATTFFPLSVYPVALQPLVVALPLYQAIELVRALTTGAFSPAALVAVGYLALLGAGGLWLAERRLARMLLV